MKHYVRKVKRTLLHLIQETTQISWLFSKNPGKDFIRTRKLDFAKTVSILLAMEGGTLTKETVADATCVDLVSTEAQKLTVTATKTTASDPEPKTTLSITVDVPEDVKPTDINTIVYYLLEEGDVAKVKSYWDTKTTRTTIEGENGLNKTDSKEIDTKGGPTQAEDVEINVTTVLVVAYNEQGYIVAIGIDDDIEGATP